MSGRARGTLAIVLLALPAAAGAQGIRDEARAHYELGRVEFSQGRYQEALAEFRRSFALAPIPDLLYDIGRSQEELHDVTGAIASYHQYLAVKPDAEERAELEAHILELSRLLAPAPLPAPAPATTTSITSAPPTARSTAISLVGTSAAPAPRRTPLYRRWWLWTAVSAVAVGAALGIGLGVGLEPSAPSLDLPGAPLR